ncbi:MAG TPA: sensor histidine kinase [Mobilitalea sp.]|nr:sensor histidine kinase [Mobilitalea sp.]
MIPIIVTDAMIMYTVKQNSKEGQMRDLTHVMERVEYNLSETVNGCILFTNNIYRDRMLDEFLNKTYINNMNYYDEYYQLLKNNSVSYNYNNGVLYKIQIFADNNTIVNGGKIATVNWVKDTDWYKAFKKSGEDIFVYTYYDESKRFFAASGTSRTISIIRKMDYFKNNGIEKILKIDVDYNLMQRDVLNENIDGEVYVRNQDYILFSSLPSVSSMRGYLPAGSIDEDKVTMSKTFKSGNQNWEILILAKNTAFWTVIFKTKGLLLLILLNIFIPTLLIYFVGRSISNRLSVVSAYMGKVKKEQFEEINDHEGEDEIGDLIRSYNLMVIKIRNLIEVVFKGNAEKQALELSKKQAELKAIQSQVNPHFLFNTLETIRMRSLIKNETETADIIGELAVLFRKSMSWGSDYVMIQDEMSFVENYINIQKYRFGDKIKYYTYIMEECKNYNIPKLSISTFIENACIHGIETTANEGVISVTITKNPEFLFIEISDNGKGFDKQKLDKLKWMIEHADSKMLNESKSTGILNTYLRLKMFCDGNISFDIDSELENGTDIMIQMPLTCVNVDMGQNTKTMKEVNSVD